MLEHLAEIRAAIATEIHDAEGAAAVRAVLLRLFEGFVLHRDSSQHEKRERKKDGSWLEPVLSQREIGAFEEKWSLATDRKPLGEATNNFSLSEMRDMPDPVDLSSSCIGLGRALRELAGLPIWHFRDLSGDELRARWPSATRLLYRQRR